MDGCTTVFVRLLLFLFMFIYLLIFMHSPVKGHLGYFQLGAITVKQP